MAHKIETQFLYNGAIPIDFHWDDEKPTVHYYTLYNDDRKLLGVTTVLGVLNKPALIPWAVNMACEHIAEYIRLGITITGEHIEEARGAHRKKSAEAANIGTQVHEWCERYIHNQQQELPTDPNVLNGVMGFLQWVDKHNVKFTKSEQIVYSKKHKYVGTMDAEALIDGKLCVIDFKTSKGVYNEMRYQVAAYQRASEEEHGKIYTGKPIIARFDKDTGAFDHIVLDNITKDHKAFLGALEIKKREDELKKYATSKRCAE